MTDIDKMPAGPELDALMAEKVMRWPRHKRSDPNYGRRPYVAEFPDGTTNVYSETDNCWSPSTDIGAAWEVLERFDFPCLVNNRADRNCPAHLRWHCTLQPKGKGLTSTDPEYRGLGPTAPLAICRAALKAIEAEEATG